MTRHEEVVSDADLVREMVGHADHNCGESECFGPQHMRQATEFVVSFGFTHDHLELVKRLADAVRTEGVTEKMEWLDEELRVGDEARLLAIAKQIAALLPHD